MTNILQTLRINHEDVKKSKKWFDTNVANLNKKHITNEALIKDKSLVKKSIIQPGGLYYFHYDPKFKDTLPYYDTYPLVFPYAPAQGGFLGLNLHYLGYPERMALFNKLLTINGSKIHTNMKLKYTWATVSSFTNVKGIGHCVKHYLYDNVRSPLMQVKPEDWTTAIMLPVEHFVGAKKEYVWNLSRRM